jgi:hypothetical protein
MWTHGTEAVRLFFLAILGVLFIKSPSSASAAYVAIAGSAIKLPW